MMEGKALTNRNAALILLLIIVIYTLVINFGGYNANTLMAGIFYFIVIAGMMIVVIKYGRDMQGNVTFGNLFAYGFKTTAMLIIFFIGFSILFYVAFPKYKLHLIDIMKENSLKNATPDNKEQVEKGLESMQRFWVRMIAGILVSLSILGAAGSLLGAAFAKRNPNNINNDFNQIS